MPKTAPKKYRHTRLGSYRSVKEIWEKEKHSLVRATDLIAHLTEDAIDVDALEEVLKEIFSDNPDVLSKGTQGERTNIRRLIRVYDYLKWGKK